MLAGRDGSRALAKMSLDESDVRDEWDDLEDLTPFQRDSLSEWEMKFQTRYAEVCYEFYPYLLQSIQVINN